MNNCDLLIIGAGPAGIFTALELVRKNSGLKIALLEQGSRMEKRACPKHKTGRCVNCKPYCNITAGFSGAGAFSDGKLSLSSEVGGDLVALFGEKVVEETIKYTDGIYLEYGADTKVEGVTAGDKVKEIRKNAIRAGLKLVDCPIRHLGTEKAQEIYTAIQNTLLNAGVDIYFNTSAEELIIESGAVKGAKAKDLKNGESITVSADRVVVAAGRKGADWLERMCRVHGIARRAGTVDIGVRVEVRNEVMEDVNNVLYESKLIGYPAP